MNKVQFFVLSVLVIPAFSMEPNHQRNKESKLALLIASWAGTTVIAYPMVKRYCPLGDECMNFGLAASLGMFGQCFAMNYYYPETEEECAMHNQQINPDAAPASKKIIEKPKQD